MKVDYGREADYAVLLPKIVCRSNRPAQVRNVGAGRRIWRGTVVGWPLGCVGGQTQNIKSVARVGKAVPESLAPAMMRCCAPYPVDGPGPSRSSVSRAALAPVWHVVLILPSPDAERSVCTLRSRSVADTGRDWVEHRHDLAGGVGGQPTISTLATVTPYIVA